MDPLALLFALVLLWASAVGLPTPNTGHHQCHARCALLHKASSDLQTDSAELDFSTCSSEESSQCVQCMEQQLEPSQYTLCSNLCVQHSSCEQVCAKCLLSIGRSPPSISMSMAEARGQSLRLLCRDANEGGAVLVLAFPHQLNLTRALYRQKGTHQWASLNTTQFASKEWMRLENLEFSSQYEVNATFKEENASAIGVFETLSENQEPLQVRDVLVDNYVSGADGALYANVSWKPAVDAVCCYSVFKDVDNRQTCVPGKNFLLDFAVTPGEIATFRVRATTFLNKDSPLKDRRISIPFCPENLSDPQGNLLSTTLKHCLTEPPENVCSLERPGPDEDRMSIVVNWKLANTSSRAPPIIAFRIKIKSTMDDLIEETSQEVMPHKTTFTWKLDVKTAAIKFGYNVEIVAESSLGLSVPKIQMRRRGRGPIGFRTKGDSSCPTSSSWANLTQQNSRMSNSIPQAMPVVTASAGLVVLTVCVVVVAFVSHKKRIAIRRRREDKSFSKFSEMKTLIRMENGLGKATTTVSSPETLRLGHKLGEGHFGVVYKAEMWQPEQKKWMIVAAKTLKGRGDDVSRTQFLQESALMKEVGRHAHVVSLLGEGDLPQGGGMFMAVEFCQKGDLLTLLRSHYLEEHAYVNEKHLSEPDDSMLVCNQGYGKIVNGKTPLAPLDLLSFARQIALGMEYLASIRIVHRDLAARNVLVTADLQMKVADFGLSRDVYEGSVYVKQQGPASLPIRWMALEAIDRSMYTSASDMWSFGVLLWEMWSMGKEPYAGMTGVQVLEALKQGHRLSRPDECPPELYEVMTQCWSESPLSRPTFGTFRLYVESMIESNSYLAVSESLLCKKTPVEDSPTKQAQPSSEE